MVVIKLLIEDLKLRMAVLNLRRVDEDERCCFRERGAVRSASKDVERGAGDGVQFWETVWEGLAAAEREEGSLRLLRLLG
jgi:hypothetical protein